MVSAVYDDAQVISSRGLVVIVDRAPRAVIHLYMTRPAMRQSTLSLWIQQLAFLCLSSCTLDLVQVAVSLHLSACVRWLGTRGQVSFVKQ